MDGNVDGVLHRSLEALAGRERRARVSHLPGSVRNVTGPMEERSWSVGNDMNLAGRPLGGCKNFTI